MVGGGGFCPFIPRPKTHKNIQTNCHLTSHQPPIKLSHLSYFLLSFAEEKYKIKIHQDKTISAKKKTWLAKKISWPFFFENLKKNVFFLLVCQETWRIFLGFSWPFFFRAKNGKSLVGINYFFSDV